MVLIVSMSPSCACDIYPNSYMVWSRMFHSLNLPHLYWPRQPRIFWHLTSLNVLASYSNSQWQKCQWWSPCNYFYWWNESIFYLYNIWHLTKTKMFLKCKIHIFIKTMAYDKAKSTFLSGNFSFCQKSGISHFTNNIDMIGQGYIRKCQYMSPLPI